MTVQLLGMKHTGKSSLGKKLAQVRRLPFRDRDQLLENLPEAQGRSARDVFRAGGKELFQRLEALAAAGAVQEMRRAPLVLAWGGGTIDNPPAVKHLASIGVLIHLKEKPELLFERILKGGLPAFLSPVHPWEDFQVLYRERTLRMREVCTLELELNGVDLDTAFRRLSESLESLDRPTGE
ncbi:MAG: hypothetical protein HKM05_06085 [Spirochaetales bacterium]|nr:hypothetical protein [Spirochaetales bacterium]